MEAAKDEFIMVSQWAIGENERAIKLFETLKNAVKKKDLKVQSFQHTQKRVFTMTHIV